MADVLAKVKGQKGAGGLKTPKQAPQFDGPGVRINNRYAVEKQAKKGL